MTENLPEMSKYLENRFSGWHHMNSGCLVPSVALSQMTDELWICGACYISRMMQLKYYPQQLDKSKRKKNLSDFDYRTTLSPIREIGQSICFWW
jgi:hypothetical protein